jgi:hypothetical protein
VPWAFVRCYSWDTRNLEPYYRYVDYGTLTRRVVFLEGLIPSVPVVIHGKCEGNVRGVERDFKTDRVVLARVGFKARIVHWVYIV